MRRNSTLGTVLTGVALLATAALASPQAMARPHNSDRGGSQYGYGGYGQGRNYGNYGGYGGGCDSRGGGWGRSDWRSGRDHDRREWGRSRGRGNGRRDDRGRDEHRWRRDRDGDRD